MSEQHFMAQAEAAAKRDGMVLLRVRQDVDTDSRWRVAWLEQGMWRHYSGDGGQLAGWTYFDDWMPIPLPSCFPWLAAPPAEVPEGWILLTANRYGHPSALWTLVPAPPPEEGNR